MDGDGDDDDDEDGGDDLRPVAAWTCAKAMLSMSTAPKS